VGGRSDGQGASVIAVQGLKDGAHPWLLRIHAGQMTQAVLRLGDPDHPEWLATEAAALALANDHNLAAPRLLGVDLVGPAGMLAVLMTVLPGTSRIPAVASTERLRALGAAAAAMHAVPLAPGLTCRCACGPSPALTSRPSAGRPAHPRCSRPPRRGCRSYQRRQARRCWSTATCGRATACGSERRLWASSTGIRQASATPVSTSAGAR
jgi:hypothetical protein